MLSSRQDEPRNCVLQQLVSIHDYFLFYHNSVSTVLQVIQRRKGGREGREGREGRREKEMGGKGMGGGGN